MIEAFKPGVKVRFKLPKAMGEYGARGTISNNSPPDRYGWRIPGYWGEGFYQVVVEPEKRLMLASQDELVLERDIVLGKPEHLDMPFGRRFKYLQGAFIDLVVDKKKSLDDPSAVFYPCIAGTPRSLVLEQADSQEEAEGVLLDYFAEHPEKLIRWAS